MDKERIHQILERTYLSQELDPQKALNNLKNILSSEMIFVDIGANIGQYTFQANNIMDKGSIYAIEPDPIRFSQLKNNCEKWENESYNNIYPLQILIGDRDGQANFYITNSPVSGSANKYNIFHLEKELQEAVSWEEIKVESYKIDTLFKSIEPDLIKLNVGNNELQILKGSTNLLKQGKTRFLINFQNSADKITEVANFMKQFGYYPTNFYDLYLFVNPKKQFLYRSRKKYQQIFPQFLRQLLRS